MKNTTYITITDENRKVELEINGLYLFQGYQVLESYNQKNDECYYLFFYKNNFLTGKRTTKIKRTSTLQQILTKGIYLASPHPIIQSLLTLNSFHLLTNLNTLWKQIKTKYNEVESAFILTAFDTYFKKDDLTSLFKKMCLQARRDGKFLQAYRILNLIIERYPTNNWAHSLISHIDYQKYSLKYQSDLKKLCKFDPLFVETHAFLQLNTQKGFELLLETIRTDSRPLEILALYFYKLTSPDTKRFDLYFQQLLEILPTYYSENDSKAYLLKLHDQATSTINKEKIRNHIVSELLHENHYEDAYLLLTKTEIQLTSRQIDVLIGIFDVLEPSHALAFEDINAEIFTNASTSQLEQLMNLLIPRLFESHDLTYVYQWMSPLLHLPFSYATQINTLYKIREEPEQQHIMGELYYYLNQLPQAIECFLWDIELNPTNPRPIKWLTKLYRELGMVEEANSYQYLYKQIQKSS
ncbi:hypothetical protein [Bacillus sp. PS06]|uniref:hypothetical protein n=1 Tax=Bacillus sp. PS06 TaxID=2764176 RepID=UPI00177BCEFC|nr:hypothetical protein [Bacillus sp. PS06]MBD8071267.1 hypothetical protein [Bacillus sp. PS06]